MKIKHLAYMSAIALVSMSVLSSCEKKKTETEQQGQYNGQEVKSEIAIALPNEVTKKYAAARRMPGSTVQKTGRTSFQGIEGITLIPFATAGEISGNDNRLGNSNRTLDAIASATDLGTNSNAKVYSNVQIPLTTASFLFYAKSQATGTKFQTGSLVVDLNKAQPKDIVFALEPIVADGTTLMTASTSKGYAIMSYLTSIAAAEDALNKKWYEYTDGDDASMAAMFKTFSELTSLNSFGVARMLSDLYKSLTPFQATNSMAAGVMAAINNSTYVDIDGSGNVTFKEDYRDFPEIAQLPQGALQTVWDATAHVFKEGSYTGKALPETYTYPAQLWYYANSQISTSNSSRQTLYDNSNNWAYILSQHTDATAVNSRTRAIAINDTVQYAVARLDVAVKLAATALPDNSFAAEGVATNVTANASGFPVTAVLVGGQRKVNFDFTAQTEGTEYTIYDNVMTEAMNASTAYTPFNSTLVLQNGTQDVMIAIEMENNTGKDFYGVGAQLIPAGSKFYMVAKLEASKATRTGGHVFLQDYTTTAKLNLTTLANAYNTIPDLRTPELEIGFSVDLEWKEGNTYEINL